MGGKAPLSPLAPKAGFPKLPVVKGVSFSTAQAGIRYQGRTDVMLALLAPGSVVAGVFTRSSTRSSAVLDCQKKIGRASDKAAAILVNSGNANAFTGRNGDEAVDSVVGAVTDEFDVPADRVFTSSTGVIGEKLPHEKIRAKLGELKANLSESAAAEAAQAIMTTDTYAKGSSVTLDLPGGTVSIVGIAKGSGMIAPDMATMLVFLFTDANIPQDVLQKMVSETSDSTFNCITVDSDTSTSDTLLMAATGKSKADPITSSDSKAALEFKQGLHKVMLDLAHQVIRDGEGATKFVEVTITGAASDKDARLVAMAIANSPLVKTALAGEDPNWGRIVMAVGKSGARADRDLLRICLGDILVAEKGWVSPDYTETLGADYMKRDELVISVDMGLGEGTSTVWTCDLTHGYIEINADYRS